MNEADLVAKYFAYWRSCVENGVDAASDELFNVWERVEDLVRYDPEEGWRILLRLVDAAPSDAALSYVAAGPLENFLAVHGANWRERIARDVSQSANLRRALSSVWGSNRMPVDVRKFIDDLLRFGRSPS